MSLTSGSSFFRAPRTEYHNGGATSYLYTDVSQDLVTLLKFKAPRVPEDVLYWSLSTGKHTSQTFATLADREVAVTGSGDARVLIAGRESSLQLARELGLEVSDEAANALMLPGELRSQIAEALTQRNFSFLPFTSYTISGVVIYRNLHAQPQFEGNPERLSDPTVPASHVLGVYAPRGRTFRAAEAVKQIEQEGH